MERFGKLVVRHAYAVIGLVLLVTAFAALQIVDPAGWQIRLGVDPAVDRLIAEESPDNKFYQEICRRFGRDDTIVLAVTADDVFLPDVLRRVARMTERLEDVPGVRRVLSLATAPNVRGVEGEILLDPFVPEEDGEFGDPAVLKRQALENPIYAGNLVSKDGRTTALVIQLRDMPESEIVRTGFDYRLLAIAQEEKGPTEVHMTGIPHVKAETSRTLISDLRFVVPAAFAVASIIALFSFRNWQGVLVPAVTIIIAMLWTFGVMAWAGRPLNLVTSILPAVLLAVGFGCTIHVVNAFITRCVHGTKSGHSGNPAAEAVAEVGFPLFLTSLTTVIGFLSLVVSPILAIREFGLFAALGVTASAVLSWTLIPALLHVFPRPKVVATDQSRRVDALLERLGEFNVRRRRALFVATGAASAIALYGVTKIEVSNDLIGNFLDGAQVRTHFNVINQQLGGATTFHVIVEADLRDGFKQPEALRYLDGLEAWLKTQPGVGTVTSLVDHLKVVNWAFHDSPPGGFTVPESADLVDQLLFFGDTEEIEQYVDSRFKTARLLVRAQVSDSTALSVLFDSIDEHLKTTLPEGFTGRVTGNTVLINRAINDIARGQGLSLTVAFVTIYGIMALLFASLRVGLISMLPNVFPVLVYFGTMGLLGIPLDAVMGLVASIVLGIAVDDTIHFMTRFGECARECGDEKQAIMQTMKEVGRPMTYTTVALCLGFLTLTFTHLRSQINFGFLSAFTLFVAWLVDVTLTPALCSRIRIVTLYEILRLDLGADPQHTIPLLAGLSRAQARVVALMTSLQTFAAGHRLMRRGDAGDDMYVVVDGELAVSLEKDGRRQELARLHRGDVVGEIALFHAHRTADVEVTQDARLLRIDGRSLEHLRKAYPRIAALVYRNLGEVLARRVTSTTQQLRGG